MAHSAQYRGHHVIVKSLKIAFAINLLIKLDSFFNQT